MSDSYKSVFTSASDWEFNALVGWGKKDFYRYSRSYKEAAEELVLKAAEDRTKLDTIIFPIAFLYRHYIELSLKAIIQEGSQVLNEEPEKYYHHQLDSLYSNMMDVMKRLKDEDDIFKDINNKIIHDVVKDFSNHDPMSMSARYPFDKEENESLDGVEAINIRQLAETIIVFDEEIAKVFIAIGLYEDYLGELASGI